jgi:hypothetical protein
MEITDLPSRHRGRPQHEDYKCPTAITVWSCATKEDRTPRQTGRLTVGRNFALFQTNRKSILHGAGDDHSVQQLLRGKSPRRKPRPWRKPAVNRTLSSHPGAVSVPSCSMPGYSTRILGTDRSSVTGSCNQASSETFA